MKRNHGFTLIELALVIAIIGFISVGMLRVFESLRTQTGRTDTEVSLNEAEDALRRFLLANGRLPCPAGFALPTTNANYGREAVLGNRCNPGVVTAIPNAIQTTDYAGVLPVRDLGLAGDRAVDGWQRQISYQVSIDAIVADAIGNPGWRANNLVFADSADVADRDKRVRDPAIFVLMSHGPNGNGAANVDGGVLQAPPATADNEIENTDLDTSFVQAEFSDAQDTPFDDVLRAASEAELTAPLIERGLLTDPVVLAQQQLERIEAALIAYLVADATRRPIPLGLPPGPPEVIDPDGPPTADDPPLEMPTTCNCPPLASICSPPPNPLTPECTECVNGCERTVLRGLPPPNNLTFGGASGGAGLILAGGVPLAELRLPGVLNLDPWRNPIRYATTANAVDFPPKTAPNPTIIVSAGIRATQFEAGFIIWSDGPNGRNDSDSFDPLALPLDEPSTTATIGDGAVHFACGNTAPNGDDICIQRTTIDIVGLLTKAGAKVDP